MRWGIGNLGLPPVLLQHNPGVTHKRGKHLLFHAAYLYYATRGLLAISIELSSILPQVSIGH